VIGCTPKAKVEAEMLVDAVGNLRTAGNQEKARHLPALEAVPCSDAAACEAKKICVAFAKKTIAGTQMMAVVQRGLGDVKAGRLDAKDPAAGALYARLDEASKALKEGEDALLRCDEKMMALKRAAAR
jgi:hypothetical protein